MKNEIKCMGEIKKRLREIDNIISSIEEFDIEIKKLFDLLLCVIKEWEKCSGSCDGIPKECTAYDEAKKIIMRKIK